MNATPSALSRALSAKEFSQLVATHQQSLRAFLRRLCGDHALADDMAQESFVIAWQRRDRFDAGRDFRPFLFGIAWRKLSHSRRSSHRRLERDATALTDAPATDPDLRLDLAAALDTLPEQQRAALLLCLAHEFSYVEAAESLTLPVGTVKSLVSRGRGKLQATLGGT